MRKSKPRDTAVAFKTSDIVETERMAYKGERHGEKQLQKMTVIYEMAHVGDVIFSQERPGGVRISFWLPPLKKLGPKDHLITIEDYKP